MTRFVLPFLAAFGLATEARSDDWKRVSPADKSFTVEMPAEPKLIDKRVDGPAGPIRQLIHYCRVDGALYSLQAIESPPRASAAARTAAARLERDQYLKADGGKLVHEEEISAGDLPGWEVKLEGPAPGGAKGTVASRVRMLVAEQVTYTITVMSARDRPLPEESARFFNSFRVGVEEKPSARRPNEADGSPEGVLRAFFLAMVMANESEVQALALPAEGLELLWKGTPPPPGALEQIKKQMAEQAIKALKPGDEFILPGGRKMTVGAEEVGENKLMLLPEGAPTPTRMKKVDGLWKVDARPFIAARKGAAAAKAKAEAKAKKAGN